MKVKTLLQEELQKTIQGLWPDIAVPFIDVAVPPRPEFGDYASSIALQLAKVVGMPPRDVAEKIAKQFPSLPEVKRISVEGGGFVNFMLSDKTILDEVRYIMKKAETYAQDKPKKPLHINVEFISANPTGPLTLANGRGGFFGDVLAHVYEKRGHIVEREYYVNDSGNQVNILAESVLRKHLSQNGIPTEYPDYCYKGEYIDQLARELKIPNYNIAKHSLEDIRDKIKDKIVQKMLKDIKRVVAKKMEISFDTYFSEKSLYVKGGAIDATLDEMRKRDIAYESDGALWLKTSAYGDEKDRVLKKSDGTLAYLLPDIAYQLDKLEKRGFDQTVTVLGADHHGYVGRMNAAMDMFGHAGKLQLVIMQMIRLMRDGKEVRMSKRAGTYVTIEELIDEVGIDATRYFFLMHTASSHMDFNLQLAKEKSEKNPVYYVQYAHARMCSIQKVVKHEGKTFERDTQISSSARTLIVQLMRWPDIVEETERTMSVHRIPQYAYDIAAAFHAWYAKERVVHDDGVVNQKLLDTVCAAQVIFKDVLSMMGISAPEKM